MEHNLKTCGVCSKPFEEKQFVYEVKLDNGKIILSHGFPCTEGVKIYRKITGDDWWIRRKYILNSEKEGA
jgi:hypothetical protein